MLFMLLRGEQRQTFQMQPLPNKAAAAIRRAAAHHGKARVVAATAASQREFLVTLTIVHVVRPEHWWRSSTSMSTSAC